MKKLSIKLLTLGTVFIDSIGFGIVIPLLPFYVQSFGVSESVVLWLLITYALFSFFSAPLLGSLSDIWGRRPILIISLVSSAIGWFIFGSAHSIFILFIGRIIDGLAAGNITTAQSLLADISETPQERTANMGLIASMFGIGFILSPLLTSFLLNFGTKVPFHFVASVAGINAILAYFFLPETHCVDIKHIKLSLKRINPFTPIINGIKNIEMRSIFLVWFLFGISIAIRQAVLPLYGATALSLSEKQVGLLFGLIGLSMIINQLFFMNRIWIKYFKQKTLVYVTMFFFSIASIFMTTKFLYVFIFGLIVVTIMQMTLRATLSGIIAGKNPEKRGEYLGVSNSIMSLSMIIGPLIAIIIYEYNNSLPFIIGGVLTCISLGMLHFVDWKSSI